MMSIVGKQDYYSYNIAHGLVCHARLILSDLTRLEDHLGFKIDVLCGTGLSGCMLLSAVRTISNREILIIRKAESMHGSHAKHQIFSSAKNFEELTNYVFVDDLLETGATFEHVVATLENRLPRYRIAGMIVVKGYTDATTLTPVRLSPNVWAAK